MTSPPLQNSQVANSVPAAAPKVEDYLGSTDDTERQAGPMTLRRPIRSAIRGILSSMEKALSHFLQCILDSDDRIGSHIDSDTDGRVNCDANSRINNRIYSPSELEFRFGSSRLPTYLIPIPDNRGSNNMQTCALRANHTTILRRNTDDDVSDPTQFVTGPGRTKRSEPLEYHIDPRATNENKSGREPTVYAPAMLIADVVKESADIHLTYRLIYHLTRGDDVPWAEIPRLLPSIFDAPDYKFSVSQLSEPDLRTWVERLDQVSLL